MSFEPSIDHDYGQYNAKPLHIQRYEASLRLEPLLTYVEDLIKDPVAESETSDGTDTDVDLLRPSIKDGEGNKILNGVTITKAERRADKNRLYNFSKVKKSRRWVKNILLSDSSSDEDEDQPITNEDLQAMLKVHRAQKKYRQHFYQDPELHQYQYYSVGLLSNFDKFHEHQKSVVGPKKKISKDQKKLDKKVKAKLKKIKRERMIENAMQEDSDSGEIDPAILEAILQHKKNLAKSKSKKLTPEQADAKRRRLWISIAKKEIPKAQKQKASARKEMLQTLKKISVQIMKEFRKTAVQSQKIMKETSSRAKRLTREMLVYWKKFEKVEKEHRKRVEKEALEQRKLDIELREAKRQQRKLNFLITQTELYAHFMARKLTGETDAAKNRILGQLEEPNDPGYLTDIVDDYDSDIMKNIALQNVSDAYGEHKQKRKAFDDDGSGASSFANPVISTDVERPQPTMVEGKLKAYQLKGMNWLANLYHQGINGILADEMGLGKTVQSLSCLAHLAESQGIWGPFLIIAPASTLHNWQQEAQRFVPKFKVVPYWGNTQDRRILRKFWDSKCLHTQEASFHVVITSYQLVIQDVKYFQRIKWQYMILDEAQAIKSSSSVRWKILLGFNCRNRLLLTGTPIQNSMAELWALLHFIMPTLFDSHDEFNEWFSKDIESHAEKQSGIDENQLSRLHMILKPFMLRRVKKDVENELSDKIEILVYCPLTSRQKLLYQGIKNKISIEDLLQSSTSSSSQSQTTTSSLMNLVMQFRKVCNHPELFERREAKSPFFMAFDGYYIPKLVFRDGILETAVPNKSHLLFKYLFIFSCVNIHQSLFSSVTTSNSSVHSCFSFTRFINMSPSELHEYMLGGLLIRWLGIYLNMKAAYRIHQKAQWSEKVSSFYSEKDCFLLTPCSTTYFPNISTSLNLQSFIFTSHTSLTFSFENHVIHYMRETTEHRKIRLKNLRQQIKSGFSPPQSPTKSPKHKSQLLELKDVPIHPHRFRPERVSRYQETELPAYMKFSTDKVSVKSLSWYCCDRSAAWQQMKEHLCGTLDARNSLWYGTPDICTQVKYSKWFFFPTQPGGLMGCHPKQGWSHITIPNKDNLVTDAGKLSVLDSLLNRLKLDGHRVLIYSQMTRMIDILEEYMWYRKHTYMRLDGSSKISDRRDMVADFQTRSDIFVFLLSTRAGGLGINLTAADTVIFYDSDWNPTVDQQAMDRAHRLGQTKQVTVYRLICKGTIEERILERAKEKSEIQRMVISGGNFRPDTLKPKEVVSLLIDDDEMEIKLRQRKEEKNIKEDVKEEKKKRKEHSSKKRDSGKKPKLDEINATIVAQDTESVASLDSSSMPASPALSVMSVGSEATQLSTSYVTGDDNSNDGLVIVDDAHLSFPAVTGGSVTPKRGGGRRGRPRGSGVGRRPRGRGTAKKPMSAAELAGTQAGINAVYATYGYNLPGTPTSTRQPGPFATSTPAHSPRTASPVSSKSK